MATYGKNGDTVEYISGGSVGLRAIILNNEITTQNTIKVKVINDKRIPYETHWTLNYISIVPSTAPIKKSGTEFTEWKFATGTSSNIDFQLIASELNRENPVALITVDMVKKVPKDHSKPMTKRQRNKDENFKKQTFITHFVMVDQSIINKAQNCGIEIPRRLTKDLNLFKSKNHFADIMKWVRDVRSAEWLSNEVSTNVTVRTLKL